MFTPPPPRGVRYLFLDLNSFFASCEQQERPDLRGRPVAVVPVESDSTCAIAASYEAKAYGIGTGTPIWEAKQKCPSLVCVLARHDVYVRYHHMVVEEVARHTPIGKICSIDELYSHLLPDKQTLNAAKALAGAIKAGLRKNVGACMTCSIGLAPNAFLGKLASDMMKPDGLVALEGADLERRICDLHLRDLCGIGPRMEARLMRASIWGVRDLWHLAPKQMRAIWRSVEGERFWYRLHGYEVPDLETEKSVIGHSRVLEPALRAPEAAKTVARSLCIKACERLRGENLLATQFALGVQAVDGTSWQHNVRLSPCNDNLVFIRTLHALWGMMGCALGAGELKKISISLSGLHSPAETTGDLFAHQAQAAAKQHSPKAPNKALSLAMDQIRRAYGQQALQFGNLAVAPGSHVGTKIAFTRVPDETEFI